MGKRTKPEKNKILTDEYFLAVMADGATREDISTWWSLSDEERKAVIMDDFNSRLHVLADLNSKKMDSEATIKALRMTFPLYGNPLEAVKEDGEDRVLPYELKDKVNMITQYVIANGLTDIFKRKLSKYSSYNAFMRALLSGKENLIKKSTETKQKMFCPWCGTKVTTYLDKCSKCGKSLQPKAGFMYTAVTCPKCHREIENPKSFCPHCGLNLNTGETQSVTVKSGEKEIEVVLPNESKGKMNPLSVIAFVLSIIAPFSGFVLLGIIGFILGIVSLNQVSTLSLRGKGLSIAAIVIGAIWGIFWAFVKALS